MVGGRFLLVPANARYPVYPEGRSPGRFSGILADVPRKLSQSAEAVQKRRDRKRAKRYQDALDRRQKNLSGPVKVSFVDPETLR